MQIVDRFHAQQHVSDVGRALNGATSALGREWSPQRHDELDVGDLTALLQAARTHASANDVARTCAEYLERNRDRKTNSR